MVRKSRLFAIRLLVSLNLLYAAIFLKFAGVPLSVAAFTEMSNALHGLISQPVFRNCVSAIFSQQSVGELTNCR